MVAGGTESPVYRLSIAGFAACRALSTAFNDRPAEASRPYDRDRDGFVMGEGAGVVVLEEREHALARGAKIYGEVIGYGLSGDAYHITAPAEDGDGAVRCMRMALKRAGIDAGRHRLHQRPRHLDAWPTRSNSARSSVWSAMPPRTSRCRRPSRRPATSSALPARSRRSSRCSPFATMSRPPTINLDNPSVETAIDLTPLVARRRPVDIALSNSFGFGGTNASLVFRRHG